MLKKFLRIIKQIRYLKTNIFFVKNIYARSFRYQYRGIPTSRFPFDLLNYQMILHNTKPDLIIEIGTHQGGSALYLADLMYLYNKKSEVHTIDVYASVTEPLVINNPRIKLFIKGWENYPIESAKNFKRVMVIDDGSHRSEDVFQALIKFAPLVNPGLYYIVEDGIVTSLGIESELQLNGGPIVGIQKFNRLHSSFLRDLSIEEFWGRGATANQYGYLLKR